MSTRDVPKSIRRIVEMLTSKYVQRCHKEGINLKDFANMMLSVKLSGQPPKSLLELFAETMKRCREKYTKQVGGVQ